MFIISLPQHLSAEHSGTQRQLQEALDALQAARDSAAEQQLAQDAEIVALEQRVDTCEREYEVGEACVAPTDRA